MYIQGSFNCWSIFDKMIDNFIFLWQVERFYWGSIFSCFGCKFLSSVDISIKFNNVFFVYIFIIFSVRFIDFWFNLYF